MRRDTVRLLLAWLPSAAPAGDLTGWRPFAGTKWTRRLALLARRAGFRRSVGWHDLRHTSAVGWIEGWWGEGRMSVREVQARLGHASVVTTEGYARTGET